MGCLALGPKTILMTWTTLLSCHKAFKLDGNKLEEPFPPVPDKS